MPEFSVSVIGGLLGACCGYFAYRSWKGAQRENGSRDGFVQTPASKMVAAACGAGAGVLFVHRSGWQTLSDLKASTTIMWLPVALEVALVASKNSLLSLAYYVAVKPLHQQQVGGADEQQQHPSSPLVVVDENARRIGVAKLYDRFKYTLFVFEVILTGYVAGRAPEKMHLLYGLKMLILFPLRIIEFRRTKSSLFNYELCLFVNYGLLAYLFAPAHVWEMPLVVALLPSRAAIFEGIFGLAGGPVAWYIIGFDGALSFFDRGKTTSALIHHAPILVTYCVRHCCGGALFPLPADSSNIVRRALQFYAAWVVFQFTVIMTMYRREIDSGELMCVFTEPGFEPLRKFTRAAELNKLVYFAVHGSICTSVILLTPYMYDNERVHFTYIMVLTAVAVWNGSEDTFQRLGEAYQAELKARLHIADAAADAEADGAPAETVDRVVRMLMEVVGGDSKKRPADFVAGGTLVEHGFDSMRVGALASKIQEAFKIFDLEVPELMHKTANEVAKLAVARAGKGASKIVPAPIEFATQVDRPPCEIAEGTSSAAKFLTTCDRLSGFAAIADDSKPGGNHLTYKSLKIGSLMVATYLTQDAACRATDRIGIMLPASVGATVMTMGAFVAGKVVVMLNFTMGGEKLAACVDDAGVTRILTSSKFVATLASKGIDMPNSLGDKLVFAEDVMNSFTTLDKMWIALVVARGSTESLLRQFSPGAPRGPSSVAAILFTSGSTARPKGVPLTNGNIIENLKAVVARGMFVADDVLMAALPPFHSFGFAATTVMPVIFGVRVVYFPNPTAFFDIARQMARWRPTVYFSTPSWLSKIYASSTKHPEWVSTLRAAVVGAEACPQRLVDEALANGGCKILQGYGISETAPAISTTMLDRECAGVGFPLDNVDARVVELGDEAQLDERLARAATLGDGNRKLLALLQGQKAARDKLRADLKRLLGVGGGGAAAASAAAVDLVEARLARQCILSEVEADSVDAHGKPVLGVIVVSGPNVFGDSNGVAYLGHNVFERAAPGSNEFKFDPFLEFDGKVFYNTEDAAFLTNKCGTNKNGVGCLVVRDRLKRFVKRAGEMISMGAIEQPLAAEFPLLKDATSYAVESCVVKTADGAEEPRIGALIHRDAVGGCQDEAEARIRRALSKVFTGAALNLHLPDAIILVDAIPLLGTGKLDLQACKAKIAEYFVSARNIARE